MFQITVISDDDLAILREIHASGNGIVNADGDPTPVRTGGTNLPFATYLDVDGFGFS